VYLYGKEHVQAWVEKLVKLFDAAILKLKQRAKSFIRKVKEYIAHLLTGIYHGCVELIPTSIITKEGNYMIQSISLSQEFSLSGGIKTSITQLLEFVAEGKIVVEALYNFSKVSV
jgi:hypothetical protein